MITWSLLPVHKSMKFVVWYDENPENWHYYKIVDCQANNMTH
jgi:hypothetical protein